MSRAYIAPDYQSLRTITARVTADQQNSKRESTIAFHGTGEDERIINDVVAELMADPAAFKRRYIDPSHA